MHRCGLLGNVEKSSVQPLAGYGDTGDDLMMALARKLVSGETDDAEAEDIFQRAQQVAAEADHLLVDADWERPVTELVTQVAALPSDGEQPLAELVPCGGHHGSSEQQQTPDQSRGQTLFSWAEFLAEQPEEPESRGRNSRPSGPSLFDWALEREQEAGLAAAGG